MHPSLKAIVSLAAGLMCCARAPALGAPVQLRVPFFPDTTDQCGPATLAELLSFWGKPIDPAQLRQEMYVAKLHGTLPMDLLTTAQSHGLKSEMARGTLAGVQAELS